MLFVVLIVLTIMYFIKNKSAGKRQFFLYHITLICSIFFFSSTDPFLNIPIYFYYMCFSVLYTLLVSKKNVMDENLIIPMCFLVFSMVFQIVMLFLNINVHDALLIGVSLTDTFDIEKELYLTSANFTVIKHFIFFVAYLCFIMFNIKFIQNKKYRNATSILIKKSFRILFVFLIIEEVLVFVTGFNDRELMSLIFNISTNNQTENWTSFIGLPSVSLCFNERSSMAIILIYYIYMANSKLDKNDIKWFFISLIAVIFTGSSAALIVAIIFFCIFIAKEYRYMFKNAFTTAVSVISVIIFIAFILSNANELFDKISTYLFNEEEWGSGYFRRQSNNYGFNSFLQSPIFGLGIGTVYCHSMLVQTLANIGIVGYILTIYIHCKAINKKINVKHLALIGIFIGISSSTFMVEIFTSPVLLVIFLSIFHSDNCNYIVTNPYQLMSKEQIC